MIALAPLAALLLAAAPAPVPAPALPTVALLPLEPLGTDYESVAELQAALRRALAGHGGVRLLGADETLELLAREPGLAACAEPQCLARAATVLGVDSVVSGVAGGLGGFRSLVLKRTDHGGDLVTTANQVLDEGWREQLPRVVTALMGPRPPAATPPIAVEKPLAPPPAAASWRTPLALSTSAGALAAVALGAGFGLSSQSLASALERRETGCEGTGESYAGCVAERFETGRSRARLANVFLGVGAALAAGSTALWLWPDAPASVGVGPGPAPLGVSAHGRF